MFSAGLVQRANGAVICWGQFFKAFYFVPLRKASSSNFKIIGNMFIQKT